MGRVGVGLLAQTGSWSQKANCSPFGRTNAVGFSIGSYGYIGTGYTGTPQKDLWRYDPANNSWTQMADFGGTARYAATGFSIGNFGYIGTGYDAIDPYTKDFWKWDGDIASPTYNTWTPIANFGGNGRFYAAGFSIGGKGFVGTGMNGSTAYVDFWQYDTLTDAWTPKANVSGSARSDCFAFALNGKGYIGCGRNFSGSTFYNSFYQYDTTANSWSPKTNFGGSVREGVGAFVIGNSGYAGIGSINNFGTRYVDFYKYDPSGDSWSAVASYPGPATGTTNAAGFAVGNFGYLGTGYNLAYTTAFYQYDLCSVTLTVTPTAPSCNGGSNGSVNLTVAGAVNPLTYSWSNSSTVEDPSGLSSGSYTVTVTDGMGCTKTVTVSVTQPTVLAGNITTVTNASCYSVCNGKITVAASGATPPYTYSWAPVAGSTTSISNLCAGGYTVTITDSKGCTIMKDSVITQPAAALTMSVTGTNASSACICDGSATNAVSGGTPPYTYSWCTGATTSSISALCPGTNCLLQVYDSMGCISNLDSVLITPFPLTVSMTITPATCPACPNGDATANHSGGTSPFTYLWNNGQTTQTATGLVPGTYPVCVIDSDSCVKCDSIYVGYLVGINEISPEKISISPNPSAGRFKIEGLGFRALEMEVYTIVGTKVYQFIPPILSQKDGEPQSVIVDLSYCPEGIYFVRIKNPESVLTRKIILTR